MTRRRDGVTKRTTSVNVDTDVLRTVVARLVEPRMYSSLSHAAERAFLLLLAAHGETVIRDEQEAEAA